MMRILLDESLPRKLCFELIGYEVNTVQSCGWSGLKNGALLCVASQNFDVLLTGDKNLQFQQNLSTLPMAVIVLSTVNNRLETFLPLMPQVLQALSSIQRGEILTISSENI